MRLDAVSETKDLVANRIPAVGEHDISNQIPEEFRLLPREPLKRKFVRRIAEPALKARRAGVRRKLAVDVQVPHNLVSLGDRFSGDASLAALLRLTRRERMHRVLVPGRYAAGEDVRFWLRRGVKRLDGIDLYDLGTLWAAAGPALAKQYGADVRFHLAPIEAMPFDDQTFDLIATSAVLKHVQNLAAMARETARVLRDGGWAWHRFGPLYHTYGADHCIAAYGDERGYDHLLLDESDYRALVNDQTFFDGCADPNLPFWARHEQFSFATSSEYIRAFEPSFELMHLVLVISPEAVAFRERYPERWDRLRKGGVTEVDLLVKSLAVVLRKRGTSE